MGTAPGGTPLRGWPVTPDLDSPTFSIRFQAIRRKGDQPPPFIEPGLGRWACEGKKVYPSARRAKIAARLFRQSAGHDIVAYHCPIHRQHWHLGNGRRSAV